MRRRVFAIALLFAGSTLGASEATRRVLLLQSFGRGFEPHSTFSEQFQTGLARLSPQPIEFSDVSLVAALGGGSASEPPLVSYLESLQREQRFDLVVSLGAPASRFVQRHRARLFSGTPLLIAGTDRRHLDEAALSERDAAVPIAVDLAAVFENILQVLPDTTRIVVVIGASPLERFWTEEIRREAGNLARRVAFVYADDLSFEEVRKRAATLPPGSAIFYAMMVRDAAGVPHADESALASLRAVTRAPIFGLFDFQLGRGIVGGPLVPLREASEQAVRAALDLLGGRSPSALRPPPVGPATPTFDGRELASWRIDASRLPAGSTILFRQPTLWEEHKERLIGIAALLVGQSVLIVTLLVQRRRRRQAEQAVRDLNRRLVSAQEEERKRLARELHDDVSQRLARLAIDFGRLDHELRESALGARVHEVHEGLMRASEDAHALSYRMHPSLLEDLGLSEALRAECEEFSQRSAIEARLAVQNLPARIPDAIALCLYRVVQEALRNVERHARARSVEISLRGLNRNVRLAVWDDGVGMEPARARTRPGLGIVSMRERVHMHGGTFELESTVGQGTTITVSVPLHDQPA